MRLKSFRRRPTFGDVASTASHDIGARNAIENVFAEAVDMLRVPQVTVLAQETKTTKLWECCECRQSRFGRKKCD